MKNKIETNANIEITRAPQIFIVEGDKEYSVLRTFSNSRLKTVKSKSRAFSIAKRIQEKTKSRIIYLTNDGQIAEEIDPAKVKTRFIFKSIPETTKKKRIKSSKDVILLSPNNLHGRV